MGNSSSSKKLKKHESFKQDRATRYNETELKEPEPDTTYKKELDAKIEEHTKNPNAITWLSICSSAMDCNTTSFEPLRDNVKRTAVMYDVYKKLRELKIDGVDGYEALMDEIIKLFQKQWKLLHETILELIKLSRKSEKCIWAIEDWIDENDKLLHPNDNINDTTYRKDLVIKAFNTIKDEWIKGGVDKPISNILNKWNEFAEEAQSAEKKWNDIKDEVLNHIRTNHMATFKKVLMGKYGMSIFSLGVGYGVAHIGVFAVAGVLATICGIVGGVIVAGIVLGVGLYACNKYYENQKTIKLGECQNDFNNLNAFANIITSELTNGVKDAKKIQSLIGKLQEIYTNNDEKLKLAERYVEDIQNYKISRVEKLDKELTNLRNKFILFKNNCDELQKIIKQKQQSILLSYK